MSPTLVKVMGSVLCAGVILAVVWLAQALVEQRPAVPPRAMPKHFTDGCVFAGEQVGEDGSLWRTWDCPVESLDPGTMVRS